MSEKAPFDDIEKFLSQYDGSQAQGVVKNVKGIAHELEYDYIKAHFTLTKSNHHKEETL